MVPAAAGETAGSQVVNLLLAGQRAVMGLDLAGSL